MSLWIRNQLFQLLSVVLLSAQSASEEPWFNCLTQDTTSTDTQIQDPAISPVWISVTSSTFYPGQEIYVNLHSKYPLKSYMLQARSEVSGGVDSWTTGGPHGWWPQDPYAGRCLSAADTVYYSSEGEYVTSVKALWTTSTATSLPKQIYFRASIVAADDKVWTNIKSTNIQQIKQSDITTLAAKDPTTKSPVTRPPVDPSSNSTPSAVDRVRQSILEEKIAEYKLRNEQLLKSDDMGNEGDFTRERERQRVEHKNSLRHQLVVNKRQKQDHEQQRQQILRFEIADREAHANVQGGGGSDATKLPPKSSDSGAGSTFNRTAASFVISSLIIWCYILSRN